MKGGPANAIRPSRLIKVLRHKFKRLVGKPLSDTWAALDWQMFEFGEQRPFINKKGAAATHGEFSFHTTSFWEFTGPLGRITGSEDYEKDPLPVVAGSQDFGFQRPFTNLKSQLLWYWLMSVGTSFPVVTSIDVPTHGEVLIRMTGGLALRAVLKDYDDDSWDMWFIGRYRSDPSTKVELGEVSRFRK